MRNGLLGQVLLTHECKLTFSRIQARPEGTDSVTFAPTSIIFLIFGPEIACQVPEPPKSLKQSQIELAF
jgi:hypothetical protein